MPLGARHPVILLLVTTSVCATLRVESLAQSANGFVPLFDGSLRGWTIQNTEAGNFSIRDNVLRVEGPSGWLRSERRFRDFGLRVEFRSLTPDADSGVFVRAAGDTAFMRGWPN